MVQPRGRKSFLGLLALLAGIAALVLTRFNPTGISDLPVGSMRLSLPLVVGLAALALAVIAFLAAASSPRTGTGVPILAVLVCAAASFLAWKPGFLGHLHGTQAAPAPAPPPPASVTQQPTEPAPPPEDSAAQHRPKTIFDSDYPSSPSTPAPRPETPAPVETSAAPEPVPAPAAKVDHTAAIQAARAKLDSARAAATEALQSSPAYQAAKADADAAETNLKTSRQTYDAGSPELIAASRAALNAHSKLQKMVSDAMDKDPSAQEAARELKAATGK
ncbi:MAG TPA: hypothetical protein VLJ39_20100 [Tepidisphaeraceae bacterium]|nr:hypothetical protein [Tepidisphaeraceae bacterium]